MVDIPSEFSGSSASSTRSEASSNGTVIHTPSPAEPDRQSSLPPIRIGEILRTPSMRTNLPGIRNDTLPEHIWEQSLDDLPLWLRHILLDRFPQFHQSLPGLWPPQYPLPNNPRPRQPVILDGSAGWRARQRGRTAANIAAAQLLEGMERLRQEDLRIREDRRHIAYLLRRSMMANQPIILNNVPPPQMPINADFPLRVLEDTERENVVNRLPPHDRQRSRPVRQRSDQVREELEGTEGRSFDEVNPSR
ncbi:hypothetical protein GE21DRAFT_1204200 [Neurospora crassa]|uniref:Uncharacterized protein B12F1.080 n=1 Tax=Neurospora crassa TaxID=5141 RepID=Q9P3H5_NEUCS|nr:hypothetical protein GE21DRAFT_1204200 [Neurospora crassa]CAB98220.1 putative protein [Neurospora crassa]